jgi:hypothetical protein
MRGKVIVTGMMAALVFCAGCGSERNKGSDGDSFTGGLAMKRLQSGDECSYDEIASDFAVRNTKDGFASVWRKLLKGEPPAIDFGSQVILIALRGQQQTLGNDIRIVGAERKGEVLVVRVKLINKTGLPRRKQCSPYDVVAIEKLQGIRAYRFVNVENDEQLEQTEAL